MSVQQSVKLSSAEQTANKLLNLIQELSESDNKLYDKSRKKLRDIQSTCIDVFRVISDMLEEQYIDADTIDDIVGMQSAVNSMQDRLNQLELLMHGTVPNTNQEPVNRPPKRKSTDKDTSKQGEQGEVNSNVISNIPKEQRKIIVKTYIQTLYHNRELCATMETTQCKNLITKWFETKILKASEYGGRYNLRRVKDWVLDFIIMSGYYIEEGSFEKFCSDVYTWIDKKDSYTVPYNISMCDSQRSKYMTLTALVMYDIMFDYDFITMKDIQDDYDMYLKYDSMYDLAESMDAPCLGSYTYYGDNSTMITKLGLTVTSVYEKKFGIVEVVK